MKQEGTAAPLADKQQRIPILDFIPDGIELIVALDPRMRTFQSGLYQVFAIVTNNTQYPARRMKSGNDRDQINLP